MVQETIVGEEAGGGRYRQELSEGEGSQENHCKEK